MVLGDGTVLVVGEDSIVLYRNMEAWEDATEKGQVGTIYRPVNVMVD